MTWKLETKTQDIAPTTRGEDWKTQETHYIRDERGRLVACVTECSLDAYFPETTLSKSEKAEAARLIAAAPALRDALHTLLLVVGLTAFKYEAQGSVLQEAVDHARAALAMLEAQGVEA